MSAQQSWSNSLSCSILLKAGVRGWGGLYRVEFRSGIPTSPLRRTRGPVRRTRSSTHKHSEKTTKRTRRPRKRRSYRIILFISFDKKIEFSSKIASSWLILQKKKSFLWHGYVGFAAEAQAPHAAPCGVAFPDERRQTIGRFILALGLSLQNAWRGDQRDSESHIFRKKNRRKRSISPTIRWSMTITIKTTERVRVRRNNNLESGISYFQAENWNSNNDAVTLDMYCIFHQNQKSVEFVIQTLFLFFSFLSGKIMEKRMCEDGIFPSQNRVVFQNISIHE